MRLCAATKTLKDRLNLSWFGVWEKSFGQGYQVGKNFEDNFRKGKIGPHRAQMISDWITSEDPALADKLEQDVLLARGDPADPISPARQRWNGFLQKHARFKNVEAYRQSVSKGLIELSRREPLAEPKLRLNEEFYVELKVPFDGFCAALQGFEGFWYPLPLRGEALSVPVSAGNQRFPQAETESDTDTFCEAADQGVHRFLFVSVTDKKSLEWFNGFRVGEPIDFDRLNELAERLTSSSANTWRMNRLNLMIA
ncbi:hypothetical protein IWQ54_006466 [Labrenzia sp. EL_195]|nr:hypothetical protein [Labrenzia sp. EL_195]